MIRYEPMAQGNCDNNDVEIFIKMMKTHRIKA